MLFKRFKTRSKGKLAPTRATIANQFCGVEVKILKVFLNFSFHN
jgi:hypothetical protein